MPRFKLLTAGGVAGALLLSACSSTATTSTSASTTAAPTTQAPGTTGAKAKAANIVATAVAAGQFKTLAKLLTSAGLVETLSGTAPFTVFAPTDDAFAKVDPALLEELGKDPAKLKAVLTYHVVASTVMASDVKAGEVPTVQGEPIKVSIEGTTVMVNEAKVVKTDITASNGVIHVIDSVLIPPSMTSKAASNIVQTAVSAGQFKTLAQLLTSAGLVETLSGTAPFTVFAPTDEAFAKVDPAVLEALGKDPAKLKAVLTYHVVSGTVKASDVKAGEVPTVQGEPIKVSIEGTTVMVNEAKVVKTDITASNGVIHVIDSVLLPPSMSK